VTPNMDKAIGRHLRHAAFGHAHEALAWAPLATGFAFLETPRWREGRLWAADMFAERLVAIATDGTVQTIDVPGVPTGIGWNPQGKLLVLTRDGRLLRNSGDTFDQIGPAVHDGPAPCNELTVTAGGIGLVGVFGLATGALLAVTPDGSPRMVADDLLLPNGQQLTPDGHTLLVAESAGPRITAFTVQDDGTLHDRRVWAAFGEPATARSLRDVLGQVTVWADGITLDAAGGVWVADPFGRQAFRVTAGGEVTDRISTGQLACYAAALGGHDGRTLYLCTAAPGLDEASRRSQRAATLVSYRVQIPAALPS
jgi:sugar lactone lactonase YvrE